MSSPTFFSGPDGSSETGRDSYDRLCGESPMGQLQNLCLLESTFPKSTPSITLSTPRNITNKKRSSQGSYRFRSIFYGSSSISIKSSIEFYINVTSLSTRLSTFNPITPKPKNSKLRLKTM